MRYPRACRAPLKGADAHADLEADMSTSFSTNTLILDSDDPAEAGRINDALVAAGHDRLLGTPLPIGDGRLVVPLVRPGVDALGAVKLLDAEVPGHPGRVEASLEN